MILNIFVMIILLEDAMKSIYTYVYILIYVYIINYVRCEVKKGFPSVYLTGSLFSREFLRFYLSMKIQLSLTLK